MHIYLLKVRYTISYTLPHWEENPSVMFDDG